MSTMSEACLAALCGPAGATAPCHISRLRTKAAHLWLQDNTTAVTQNFVSAVNLPHVLRFLRTGSRQLVSGCAPEERADLYHRFVAALEQKHPQVQACCGFWESAGAITLLVAKLAGLCLPLCFPSPGL